MSMIEHVAIGVETPRIDSRWSLAKEFTELIYINLLMVFDETKLRGRQFHTVLCQK